MAQHSGRSSGGCFGERAGVDVLMFGHLVDEGSWLILILRGGGYKFGN